MVIYAILTNVYAILLITTVIYYANTVINVYAMVINTKGNCVHTFILSIRQTNIQDYIPGGEILSHVLLLNLVLETFISISNVIILTSDK